MWFTDDALLQGSAELQCSMKTPSPTGGLFDIIGPEHKPPDPQEIDPELLSTLNSPRTRTSSTESRESHASSMMENWQMNEVFQDISTILDEGIDDLQPHNEKPFDGSTTYFDMDMLVKDVFPSEDTPTSPDLPAELLPTSETSVDLSWIIKETLGPSALQGGEQTTLNLNDETATRGFDLLEQLEAMPDSSSSQVIPIEDLLEAGFSEQSGDNSPSTSVSSELSTSPEPECVTAVDNDHQYTQLASVKVKPHETKKQAIRRVKNNAASRVCRRQRKNRLTTNIDRVTELSIRNSELLSQIREVENVVSLLKEHLVKATKK